MPELAHLRIFILRYTNVLIIIIINIIIIVQQGQGAPPRRHELTCYSVAGTKGAASLGPAAS